MWIKTSFPHLKKTVYDVRRQAKGKTKDFSCQLVSPTSSNEKFNNPTIPRGTLIG